MTKKHLTEADVCDQLITPAIHRAGWDKTTQVLREYGFTAGRVMVHGTLAARGKRKRADYVLLYEDNLPLAVVEAKDANHTVGAGMQQALAYAEALDVPFVFSSNGSGFLFHDRTGASDPLEREIGLNELPSPAELWTRYRAFKALDDTQEDLVRTPYYVDPSDQKTPRYYQRNAIQRAVEAVAAGQRRVLLAMATGTGKTGTGHPGARSAAAPRSAPVVAEGRPGSGRGRPRYRPNKIPLRGWAPEAGGCRLLSRGHGPHRLACAGVGHSLGRRRRWTSRRPRRSSLRCRRIGSSTSSSAPWAWRPGA